ncbi:hypothetical protein PGT21_010497 [Puccinia graminis f. sp. tritici]|uniref:Uncharacterized protein n=1 Tax=Puccinia graminis f. sp. tritici TaxID=56615 RepID=A0A5B0MXE6_PUCGR|nr:hypothetical protein PGT21_010497 [Puccinia graminis f. sp. tritici]KAA1131496.1 hypothetical protein PGTUg99_021599 [Puccinia graminis f. sp. tritici]
MVQTQKNGVSSSGKLALYAVVMLSIFLSIRPTSCEENLVKSRIVVKREYRKNSISSTLSHRSITLAGPFMRRSPIPQGNQPPIKPPQQPQPQPQQPPETQPQRQPQPQPKQLPPQKSQRGQERQDRPKKFQPAFTQNVTPTNPNNTQTFSLSEVTPPNNFGNGRPAEFLSDPINNGGGGNGGGGNNGGGNGGGGNNGGGNGSGGGGGGGGDFQPSFSETGTRNNGSPCPDQNTFLNKDNKCQRCPNNEVQVNVNQCGCPNGQVKKGNICVCPQNQTVQQNGQCGNAPQKCRSDQILLQNGTCVCPNNTRTNRSTGRCQ